MPNSFDELPEGRRKRRIARQGERHYRYVLRLYERMKSCPVCAEIPTVGPEKKDAADEIKS